MLSTGAEIDQEIKAVVGTAHTAMQKHVSTVVGHTIEVIVLHLGKMSEVQQGQSFQDSM